mmetsp:Transcript_10187/g.11654  ORF Transcript_10187/g.11654 Transcript_10187/m.11654 type:complete len:213 (+) Transcript_10187:109-747(+)
MGGSSDEEKNNIPFGWDKRNNQMSEEEIKLGGDASNKYSSSNSTLTQNAYADETSGSYKSTDQVRDFYMSKIEASEKANETKGSSSPEASKHAAPSSSVLPHGWAERQKIRSVEELQYGVASSKKQQQQVGSSAMTMERSQPVGGDQAPSETAKGNERTAEVELIQGATHTLEALARFLDRSGGNINVPVEDRSKFANSIKRAMDAMIKNST